MVKGTKRIINKIITMLIMDDSYRVPSFIDSHIQYFRKLHGYSWSPSITDHRGGGMTREYVATAGGEQKAFGILEEEAVLSHS